MKVIIKPGAVKGTIHAPASKSAMQRACALALLHEGKTSITNPGISNDDKAALSIITALGASVSANVDGSLEVTGLNGSGDNTTKTIDCGESGLSIRMFAPIAALQDASITVTGSGSLLKRPMDFFDEVFPSLGIFIKSNNGHLPLEIKGPLKPADITIDGSLSSQFLTGLLIAFAKGAAKQVTIAVSNLKSRPYIDLTLQLMKYFGYKVQNNHYESFTIEPATASPDPVKYTVEGDWSGAAFLLVAGAVSGSLTVKGLDVFSAQADKAILQVLMAAKANISITPEEITVSSKKLDPFHFNATDCPDLFPPLVALAAYCDGTSVIEGVSRLTHKESNRALTLQEEFGKIGIGIKLQDDLMIIEGGTPVNAATVHSRHDHRIAMALAVAALRSNGAIEIEEAEAINKSYPSFYEHFKMMGVDTTIFE
ncbi:3-phosphoshikimate 1-carboxyvinyltransferase [Ferruginibacter sp. HRS2-29]|uniref:3-phosphoshikimate 1-carboxyvinyltransferase n=1 Tax=Ferruginibacter sp. HRS2-29 TaxID=2487334 RepID=UPI0020CF09FB|nr:3-phosphoshikimate 1-carboxyvinyltransferase [Ferruginibacter sp. HRS2-29]MCP9751420.1 3-phosphoshikimate 1-carboxyvinyltransferase [Ferruginibacter sp. HRS2-29]